MMHNESDRTTWTGFEQTFLAEDYVDVYDNLDRKYGHIYRASANRLIELADIGPGSSVIDIGAGTGTSTLSAWDAMRFRGELLAIEPSTAMLRRAQAKPELSGVKFYQGTAEDVADVVNAAGMRGQVDAAISSFTYYYTYQDRQVLHRLIHSVLTPGGRWVFNLTRYLSPIRIHGEPKNTFSGVFEQQLRKVAQQHGIRPAGETSDPEPEQFIDMSQEERWLRLAGFTTIEVEAWPLPLTPSQAYQFTIDGFYRHGSYIEFAEWLMNVSLEQRTQILLETLARCAEELDRFPRPQIANFRATSLSS